MRRLHMKITDQAKYFLQRVNTWNFPHKPLWLVISRFIMCDTGSEESEVCPVISIF